MFPVIDSTVSPEALSHWLHKNYDFNDIPAVRLFRTGINHTYMVEGDSHRSVLRLYSHGWRSRVQIEEEIKVVRLAQEAGMSVSCPLADSTGNLIHELEAPEGTRLAMLFSFAEGKKVRHFSDGLCERLGEAMGRFHRASEGKTVERVTYNADSLITQPYGYARKFFSQDNADMQFIRRAGEKVTRVFADADQDSIRKGIVHMDIWYDNMSITPEEEFTVFDFDFCGNGWLLHDIAYFLMQLRRQESDMEVYEQKREAFLRGYRSVSTISGAEMALLPWSGLSIWIFYLGVQCRRFDNWSNVFLSENYLTMFIGMAKDWLAYNGEKLP